MKPIPGTEEHYECDTLLLSCGLLPENELSKTAGVSLSPITSGPVVNDSLETSVEGIFACGNVLHVHDLVDFVSEEAKNAGFNAAKYIKEGKKVAEKEIKINPTGGVRYTVPVSIRPKEMDDSVTVRFRVGQVFKNSYVAMYYGDTQVLKRKKQIMAPGEMEQVIIKKEELNNYPDISEITVKIEAE